ncbi:MAG: arginine--tRNA ligase, partial [Catenulispora sp.]
MTPEQLRDLVRTAVAAVAGRGALGVEVPDEVVVERPKNPQHGDYATNVALRLAKPAGRPPRAVADLLAAELRGQP